MLQNINNQEHTNDSNLSHQNTDTLLEIYDNMIFDDMMFDDSENKETQCMICYEDIDEINWLVWLNIKCTMFTKSYIKIEVKSILCPFCRNVIEKPINTKKKSIICHLHKDLFKLSRHPLILFYFNIFMFFIFIGMIIFAPRK